MFLELIGTVFAGFAVAGVMMLVNRLTGGRLPRWTAPAVAGLAMIAVTVSMEYSWYERTRTNLPEGLVIAKSIEKQSMYRPWTYVTPYIDRFVAVDQLSLRRNEQLPDQRMVDLYFFGRWAPLNKVAVIFDCANARQATLIDDVNFTESGALPDGDWVKIAADDSVLTTVCEVS